ncbi:hypothetical protein [Bradyrhizobium sp. BRP23]|uniref:hypothetical protein n=1 Tax=Bradyrhizobium sp. BRP23 TaxID=2793820 RepID=UPI001CD62D36|nr:hypothetical protein [Bradyrhizobium sp. BRP23]MCA1419470.1 hypothetical protein [Bradyrhizobium sp. BRP23]
MKAAPAHAPQSKRRQLDEILGALGGGRITLDEYHRRMKEAGLTEDDVDDFCQGKLK